MDESETITTAVKLTKDNMTLLVLLHEMTSYDINQMINDAIFNYVKDVLKEALKNKGNRA